MNAETSTTTYNTTHDTAVAARRPPLRVSWGAIFAGTVVGMAVLFMLSLLAVGIGSATIDPAQDANPLSGVGMGSAIFAGGAQLIALAVGGFVAARLAGIPLGLSSALHGAAVWALATFAMLFLATTTVSGVMGGTASLLGNAGSGAASAVQAVVPNDISLGQIDKASLPQPVQDAMEEQNITAEDLQADAQAIFQSSISDSERQEIMTQLRSTATSVVSAPGSAGEEINQLIDRLVGGENGVISEQDKQEAVSSLSNRLDISEQEARTTIDQWQTQMQESVEAAKSAAQDAQQQAVQAAQKASEALSTAALGAFAATLIGLLVAMLAGYFGRQTDLVAVPADRA